MTRLYRKVILTTIGLLWVTSQCVAALEPRRPLIFPPPKKMTVADNGFVLDGQVTIVVPSKASEQDLALASFLRNELGDRFGMHPKTERVTALGSGRRVILMGSVANPLVRAYCAKNGIVVSAQDPGPEGYVLRVSADLVFIAGSDDRGAFYGLQSLRQLAEADRGQVQFHGVDVRDWPDKAYRGIKLYLPGRSNIPFLTRFVRDFTRKFAKRGVPSP